MEAIIFDLDGTLTDTIWAITHFGNTALSECGFNTIDSDTYKYLVGNGRDILIHRMLNQFDADTDENFRRVCAVYDKCYEENPLYDTDAYDGIKETLTELKARKIKLAVCSNKPGNVVLDVADKIFGKDIFDYVYGETSGIPIKPDPAPALHVAKKLGADPRKCIFTGDTDIDIYTAKNAGMTSVGVLWGFRDYDELKAAGADYIIKHPAEYLNLF